MFSFSKKQLNQSSGWGEELRKSRMSRSWSLADATRRSRIKVDYLKALEDENIQDIPRGVYAVNFLRRYAGVLNISKDRIDEMAQKIQSIKIWSVKDNFIDLSAILKRKPVLVVSVWGGVASRFFLVAIIFVYLAIGVAGIFVKPKLDIDSPSGNSVLSVKYITVSGETEKEAVVRINGEYVKNNGGKFSEAVYLRSGINVITVSAQKKYGQISMDTRRILVN